MAIYKEARDSRDSLYKLPSKFNSLSLDGNVRIVNNTKGSAVLFYTFQGIPDGMSGFVKVFGNSESMSDFFVDDKTSVKDLGENWYYINGK